MNQPEIPVSTVIDCFGCTVEFSPSISDIPGKCQHCGKVFCPTCRDSFLISEESDGHYRQPEYMTVYARLDVGSGRQHNYGRIKHTNLKRIQEEDGTTRYWSKPSMTQSDDDGRLYKQRTIDIPVSPYYTCPDCLDTTVGDSEACYGSLAESFGVRFYKEGEQFGWRKRAKMGEDGKPIKDENNKSTLEDQWVDLVGEAIPATTQEEFLFAHLSYCARAKLESLGMYEEARWADTRFFIPAPTFNESGMGQLEREAEIARVRRIMDGKGRRSDLREDELEEMASDYIHSYGHMPFIRTQEWDWIAYQRNTFEADVRPTKGSFREYIERLYLYRPKRQAKYLARIEHLKKPEKDTVLTWVDGALKEVPTEMVAARAHVIVTEAVDDLAHTAFLLAMRYYTEDEIPAPGVQLMKFTDEKGNETLRDRWDYYRDYLKGEFKVPLSLRNARWMVSLAYDMVRVTKPREMYVQTNDMGNTYVVERDVKMEPLTGEKARAPQQVVEDREFLFSLITDIDRLAALAQEIGPVTLYDALLDIASRLNDDRLLGQVGMYMKDIGLVQAA